MVTPVVFLLSLTVFPHTFLLVWHCQRSMSINHLGACPEIRLPAPSPAPGSEQVNPSRTSDQLRSLSLSLSLSLPAGVSLSHPPAPRPPSHPFPFHCEIHPPSLSLSLRLIPPQYLFSLFSFLRFLHVKLFGLFLFVSPPSIWPRSGCQRSPSPTSPSLCASRLLPPGTSVIALQPVLFTAHTLLNIVHSLVLSCDRGLSRSSVQSQTIDALRDPPELRRILSFFSRRALRGQSVSRPRESIDRDSTSCDIGQDQRFFHACSVILFFEEALTASFSVPSRRSCHST